MKSVFDFLDEEKVKPEPSVPFEPARPSIFEKEAEVFKKAAEPIPEKEEFVPKSKPEEFPFEGENDLEREIERGQARTLSRIGETVLGAPGDISNFVTSLFGLPKSPIGYASSENLQKASEKLTKGFTNSETEFEKTIDDAAKTFATMALPGSWGYSFARNLGIPLAATLTKEGVKKYAGDTAGTYAELGTMLGLDLLGGRISSGGAKGYASNLFKQRDKTIPEGAALATENLQKSISSLKKELLKGGEATSTDAALQKLDQLAKKIEDNKIPIDELTKFQERINEKILEQGGFKLETPPKVRERSVENLNKVKRLVIESLGEYGEKQNPEFLDLHRKANKAFATFEKSNVITNFIQKKFGNKIKNPLVKTLFGLGTAGGAGTAALTSPAFGAIAGGVGAGGAALYQGMKIFYRVAKSPELRKYYTDVVKNALAGNAIKTKKSLDELDKRLKDEEKELEERLLREK